MSASCYENLGKRYFDTLLQRLSPRSYDIKMATYVVNPCPNVYLFKEDYRRMEELVRLRPTEETGGDLFGLWTNNDEPVFHIITGQGTEIQQTQQDVSSKNADSIAVKLHNLDTALRKRFHLSYIGKWQYKRRSEQNDMAIRETAGGRKDFVLIMADYDDLSKRLKLSPYLLSEFSTVTKGNYETLPEESAFRKDDDIGKLVDELTEKGGLKDRESDPDNPLAPKQPAHENPDENVTGAPLTGPMPQDVEMPEEKPSRSDPTSDYGLPNHSRLGAGIAMPRLQTDFVCNQRDFKVHISQEDEEMMNELVLRYPNVETGGDLFGLWTTEGDAMIHIVLGPGQDCKRTGTSFYQDIPYLQRNGELLTQKYMLCHIGEWHSHHQLRLSQPSQGDSSTVIRNYPRGTCGFLLIIANIVPERERAQVTLSPYLYTANSSYHFDQKGTLVHLPCYNAFKKDVVIESSMERGKEKLTERNYQRDQRGVSMQVNPTEMYSSPPKRRQEARSRFARK